MATDLNPLAQDLALKKTAWKASNTAKHAAAANWKQAVLSIGIELPQATLPGRKPAPAPPPPATPWQLTDLAKLGQAVLDTTAAEAAALSAMHAAQKAFDAANPATNA